MTGPVKSFGPAVLSGLLLAFSFPSFHWYLLVWIGLVPLFASTWRCGPKAAFGRFFLAGWVFYSVMWYWLAVHIYWAGGWAVVGQQAVCVYMALYWGAVGGTWSWLRSRTGKEWGGGVFLAAAWPAIEQLQGLFLTGFSGGALAYSQGPDLALVQWAAVGSTAIITAFIVYVNVHLAAAVALREKLWLRAAAAIGLFVAAHGVGALLLQEAAYGEDPFRVGLVQSNFSVEMKWDGEYDREMVRNAIEKSEALVQSGATNLVVWPEALIVSSIRDPYVREAVTGFTRVHDSALYTGSVRTESDPYRSYNSSFFVDKEGAIGEPYDKLRLAPFGEYMPFVDLFPFMQRLIPAIGALTPGTESRTYRVDGRVFGPLICFEVMFPSMTMALRDAGADFLVVITNLGWFGASSALPMELEVTRLRAIETRLPLVHCANTGISGVFDPWGRFSAMNGQVSASGAFIPLGYDIAPRSTIRRRLVGAFPLPSPGEQPLPYGPVAIPWVFTVAAFLVPLSVAIGIRPAEEAHAL